MKINFIGNLSQVTTGFLKFETAEEYLNITMERQPKSFIGGHIEEHVENIGWVIRDTYDSDTILVRPIVERIKNLINGNNFSEDEIAQIINLSYKCKLITTEEMLLLCGAFGICDIRKYYGCDAV